MIQTIGMHAVRQRNVMDVGGIAELMGDDKADVIAPDPLHASAEMGA